MIRIPEEITISIKNHGEKEAPIEACGYLAGRGNEIREIFPMTNVDQSEEHFTFDPEEQFKVLDKTEESGLDIIAVYHSHPETPARMSEEDLKLAIDKSIIYFIYSLSTEELKAFKMTGEKEAIQVTVEVIP